MKRGRPRARAAIQPFEPEPPDEDELVDVGAVLDEPPEDDAVDVDALAVSPDELPLALLEPEPPDDEPPPPPDLLLEDEYKSAYQPPPFRMKFPPLIWRLALACPHFGHVSMGAAEIF